MKKQLLKGVLAAVAAVGLLAGSAMADAMNENSLGIKGNVTYDRNGDGTGTIALTDVMISTANPGDVNNYFLGMTIDFSPIFNFTNVTNDTITFAQNNYNFSIWDGNTQVLSAVLTLSGITPFHVDLPLGGSIDGAVGNPKVEVNLTAVEVYVDPSFAPMLTMFDQTGIGTLTLSFDVAGNYVEFLKGSGTEDLTFSGTIRPAAVPEPATMLLFGTGLLGLAGVARRKSSN